MAYTLSNKYAKNLCKRTVPLQLIIKNVVTCYFLEHSVYKAIYYIVYKIDTLGPGPASSVSLGSGSHVVGRLRSGMRVSASFQLR